MRLAALLALSAILAPTAAPAPAETHTQPYTTGALGDLGLVHGAPYSLGCVVILTGESAGFCDYASPGRRYDVRVQDDSGVTVPFTYEFLDEALLPITQGPGCGSVDGLPAPPRTIGLAVVPGGAASVALNCPGAGPATSGVVAVVERP